MTRIAVCQHPNGEGLYVPLKPGESSSPCFQHCDCTPVVYVPETLLRIQEKRIRNLESDLKLLEGQLYG